MNIKKLIDDDIYEKGVALFRKAPVSDYKREGDTFSCIITDKEKYNLSISFDKNGSCKLISCSCDESSKNHKFCKHEVAFLLYLLSNSSSENIEQLTSRIKEVSKEEALKNPIVKAIAGLKTFDAGRMAILVYLYQKQNKSCDNPINEVSNLIKNYNKELTLKYTVDDIEKLLKFLNSVSYSEKSLYYVLGSKKRASNEKELRDAIFDSLK